MNSNPTPSSNAAHAAHATSPNPPFTNKKLDLVIFGGSGDLSMRKLLPALYMAHLHDNLPSLSCIHILGRQDWNANDFAQFLHKNVLGFIDTASWQKEAWDRFCARLRYTKLDANQVEDFNKLAKTLQAKSVRVYYLATASALFAPISAHLHAANLIDENSRVVLEKPLGTSLQTAREISTTVGKHFAESQIFRIDHYLGKETVQNLMVLRFGNCIFEPLWRAPYVKSIQITVAESVGVGSRAGFYDGTGALRDMVQNHLLQLLCIVAMEPPVSLDPDAVRDEKLKVLRSLAPMTSAAEVARSSVRGQYAAGVIAGETVPGYLDEDQVPQDSKTETFVALRTEIRNWRWAGVPIFLRTGKRMPERYSEIAIEFAQVPHSIFPDTAHQASNQLRIRLQPEEHIQLHMMAKEPGSGMRMRPASLNLDLEAAFLERRAEAYERLLLDVIRGRLTHFMRRDELEAAWVWVDGILQGWAELDEDPKAYAAGSWGPAAASALIARDNTAWIEEI